MRFLETKCIFCAISVTVAYEVLSKSLAEIAAGLLNYHLLECKVLSSMKIHGRLTWEIQYLP